MMCIRSPQRFGLESERHICHPACWRFYSPFNYIFIFVVAKWCVEARSATDPRLDPTEIEHPPYPTINPPRSFPFPPPSILPWGLCKYFSCDFTSLSWSGIELSPSILLATRWQAAKGSTTKKKTKKNPDKQMYVRGRKIEEDASVGETGAHRAGCTSREMSLFNQILAGGWFDVCNITFTDFFPVWVDPLGVQRLFAWIQIWKSNENSNENRLVFDMTVSQNL